MNLKKIKNLVFLIFSNINFTILLIFYLSILSIVFYQTYIFFGYGSIEERVDILKNRFKLETHQNYTWSKQYFDDEQKLKAEYIPIIGFKEKKFNSETIKTDKDGYRISRNNSINNPDIIFLGGSTMFGYGSNDINTIPSIISELLKDSLKVRNLGNGSHNSTQNLIKFYDQIILRSNLTNPKFLVCYEGVNEIQNLQINSEWNLYHSYADYFKNQIDINPRHQNSLNFEMLFKNHTYQIKEFIFLGLRKLGFIPYKKTEEIYNLDDLSVERASMILLENWKLIYQISVEKGIRPFFFLQPHISSNNHKDDYLIGIEKYEKIYSKLYSKILEKINKEAEYKMIKENFFDLSKSLDDKKPYFYDYCHLNPLGNRIISIDIIKKIFK